MNKKKEESERGKRKEEEEIERGNRKRKKKEERERGKRGVTAVHCKCHQHLLRYVA